jgi:hypothetical protein
MRELLTILDSITQKQKCLYVPRKQGGRDLLQLEAYAVEITKLLEYTDRRKIH